MLLRSTVCRSINVRSGVGPSDVEISEERGDALEVIEAPRSAWMFSVPRPTPCAMSAAEMNSAVSVVATIHPTTYREKISIATYKSNQTPLSGPKLVCRPLVDPCELDQLTVLAIVGEQC